MKRIDAVFFQRILIAVTLVFALGVSWGEPLLSSHYLRQIQTAETAEIFALEGWDFLYPKLRHFGRPGYTLLEAPIYQTAIWSLNRITELPIDQSARLLSFFFGLLLNFGLLSFLRRHTQGSDRPRAETAFLIFISCPLVLGMSQWSSIELMNCAFGAWALVFFDRSFEANSWGRRFASKFGLFVCASISLLLKPVVVFALLPVFAWVLWKNRSETSRVFFVVSTCLVSGILMLLWFRHAAQVNASVASPVSLQGNLAWYFFNPEIYTVSSLAKLVGRFLVYVLGPGTLVLITYSAISDFSGLRERIYRSRALFFVLGGGIVLYLLTFMNLNVHHNYYQSPMLFPLYLMLLLAIGPALGNRIGTSVLCLAVAVNIAVAQTTLARQDRDLEAALEGLKKEVLFGAHHPDMAWVTNNAGIEVALGYYLGRYGQGSHPSGLKRLPLPEDREFVAVCDPDPRLRGPSDGDCEQDVVSALPECAQAGKRFGRLWICHGRGDSAR